MSADAAPLHCPCNGAWFVLQFAYDAPPHGEVRFAFADGATYRREVRRCTACGHFVSLHRMNGDRMYADDYMTSTYGSDGIGREFDRIVSLDPSRSDNAGRVRRIRDFAERHFGGGARGASRTLLDVGSGLGVFVHRMKAEGWICTALDPDPRAVRHAREVVGVAAVEGDFMARHDFGRFHLVTFNKVLEHVQDPVAMLARGRAHLERGGFVYVEVPDGETAAAAGAEREEFFIEHHHVFSAVSLALLACRAAFSVSALERLWEPSGKYTLRALLTAMPPPDSNSETTDVGAA